ncbi:WEB family protein At3g02930, chloroplastic-like [Anneissia japonica]|uniref:WEB family protein At3g02930, chloroplastic-like n=1 Tax=Anneissia japonica TaxID=1529436 RepID=UPI0014255B7A|nr:WEB family protein At3g02930, chloroplastic-like [Anneissia japonica]
MASDSQGHSNKSLSKKSFEIKMCKKVAELTQVVHMLFTKNHEREIEIATMTKEYESEISRLVHTHSEKIRALSNDVKEIKVAEERASQKLIQNEKECKFKLEQQKEAHIKELKSAENVRDDLQLKIDELLRQIDDLEEELEKIGKRNDHLEAVLQETKANQVSQTPITDAFKQKSEKHNDKTVLPEESDQLLKLKERLEDEKQKHAQEKLDLESRRVKLQCDLEEMEIQMQKQIEDALRELTAAVESRERILERNEKLENELKALNEKLKLSQEISVQKKNKNLPIKSTATSPLPPIEVNEEMERLKREIKHYRLELSNREGNFNRMFTNTLPVRLNFKPSSTNLSRGRTEVYMARSGKPRLHQSSSSSADKSRIFYERLPTLTTEHIRQKTARYPRPESSLKSQRDALNS